jgi:GT2 family glycosyltransferase
VLNPSVSHPDLSISIVNHSNPELLRDCIRSIYSTTRRISFDVWVVDNATDGNLVPDIQREFPEVKWLFNSGREGFSANHNKVLASASARYICILNDDTIVRGEAFDELVSFLDTHADVGMVGPKVLNADGTLQDSVFYDVDLLYYFAFSFICPARLVKWRSRRWVHLAAQGKSEPSDVEWLLGACITVRTDALDEIGLLDSDLSPLANMEDVEWCWRCRRAGYRVVYCPGAQLTHFGGMSLRKNTTRVNAVRIEMMRTSIAYLARRYGGLQALLLRVVFVVALPWNLAALAYARMRGKSAGCNWKAEAATHWHIARMALLERIRSRLNGPARRPWK